MINVEYYKPSDSVKWLIKQFEIIKISKNTVYTDNFIPRPDVALVFHFQNIPQIINSENISLPPIFLAPVVSKTNHLYINGELDSFIVVCKASVFSRLFKLDLTPGAKMFFDLTCTDFYKVWENLQDCHSDAEKTEYFSRFVQECAPDGYSPDNIDILYDIIIADHFNTSTANFTQNSIRSVSSLQRNFKKRVGVNMKTLIRVSRTSFIFDKMIEQNTFNYQDLLFEGNYYDQAHFIKDFKEFTGKTPKQFFHNNSDICKIISGKQKIN